jgi:hypothetical protein
MSTSVLYQEPGGLAAQAAALFTSDLSARCEPTRIEVAAAIKHAIGTHHGIDGCVAAVAAAYGEYPETAAGRMRWARAIIEGTPAADGEATPGGGGVLRTRLAEQGYVSARFGGLPVLVGPKLAAQLKSSREKRS